MAQLLQLTPQSSLFHLNHKIPTHSGRNPTTNRCQIPFSLKLSAALTASAAASNRPSPPVKFASLTALKPYLQSEWRPILSGWLCSAVSVYSLSKIVPLSGKLSSILAAADFSSLRNEGLILGVLVLTRIVSNYLQQAFLWEAALNCAYKVRVYVFNRVLQRDLGFFEGEKGVLPGDVAYRITAEAEDISDTVYSLLNVRVCFSI